MKKTFVVILERGLLLFIYVSSTFFANSAVMNITLPECEAPRYFVFSLIGFVLVIFYFMIKIFSLFPNFVVKNKILKRVVFFVDICILLLVVTSGFFIIDNQLKDNRENTRKRVFYPNALSADLVEAC